MAMPRNIRLLWRIWGAVLTVVTVAVMAITAWAQISEYRYSDFDRVYPGFYGADLVSAETRETSVIVYRITSPVLIVDAEGPVRVSVSRGAGDRLTMRRELAWGRDGRDFHQEWESGKVLRVSLSCAAPYAGAREPCSADYRLTVPPGVKVLVADGPATRECPVTGAATVCRPAGGPARAVPPAAPSGP
jgi:hypothetical protein